MREILFRGKRVDNGEWILGGYAKCNNRHYILPDIDLIRGEWVFKNIEVIPETVGQFTGLTDRNGTKIFEGDIVKTKYGRLCRVIFFESSAHRCWDLVVIGTTDNVKVKAPTSWDLWYSGNLEVIGNIHDNPELLQEDMK